MDKITRHELKTDKFAQEVGHTVEFLSAHRRQAIWYGAIAGALVIVTLAGYVFLRQQKATRQRELRAALEIYDAAVGAAPQDNPYLKIYPTAAEKEQAIQKAFGELATRRAGKAEGAIARYYLAIIAADQGRMLEAEKGFQEVVETGDKDYASLARLALAQLYHGQGKTAAAEQLLRPLIAKPTAMVSKEQAAIALGRILAASKPAEARKLLEPLRTERGPVSRAALTALSDVK